MRRGWTETSLGEIASLSIGRTPSRSNKNYWTEDLTYPFCTIADMDRKNIFPKREGVSLKAIQDGKAKIAPTGTLLMSFKLTIGRMGFAGQDIYPNEAIVSITPYPQLAMDMFLYYLLGFQDLTADSGRAVKGETLNSKSLSAIPISLPPLVEQRRIVDLVSSVDAYIAALEHQADTARTARNAVLHELLSAGGDDWTKTTLGEIGLTGMFADGDWVESKDQDPEGEFRLLQLADVGDGVFLDKSNRWMNSEQFSRLRCTPLRPRDILIARMPDPIARACVLPSGLMSCATVVDVAILRCGEGYVPEFVALVINDSLFRAKAQSLLTGTTRQRISRSNLAEIVFMVPSIAEQKRIVATVSSMDEVIQSTEHSAANAMTLRSGLLSDLLFGKVEIPTSYDRFLRAAERFSYA